MTPIREISELGAIFAIGYLCIGFVAGVAWLSVVYLKPLVGETALLAAILIGPPIPVACLYFWARER